MMVQKELLTQIAIYLKVNVLEVFTLAFDYYKSELPDVTPKVDYDQFILMGTIPRYVHDFCELIIEAM